MAREHVTSLLTALFHKTGAIDFDTPLLAPFSQQLTTTYEPVKLLDSTGSVVVLPGDLGFSFARFVARTSGGDMRRYHFGHVYREGAPGYQPEVRLCRFST